MPEVYWIMKISLELTDGRLAKDCLPDEINFFKPVSNECIFLSEVISGLIISINSSALSPPIASA